MHVQSCFCANLTSCFFAVLADVSVVAAKAPYYQFSLSFFPGLLRLFLSPEQRTGKETLGTNLKR